METVDEKLAKLKNEIFKNNTKVLKKIIEHMADEREQIIKAVLNNGGDVTGAHGHGHDGAHGHGHHGGAHNNHGHGHH